MIDYDVKVYAIPIIVSIGISFLGAFAAISVFEQYRVCKYMNITPKWFRVDRLLLLISIQLGGVAIWTMHFVGMYSCRLYYPIDNAISPIYYRVDITIASLIVVIVLCYLGLYIASTSDTLYMKDRTGAVEDYFKRLAGSSHNWSLRNLGRQGSFLYETLSYNLLPIGFGGICTAAGVCVMHYIGMKAMVFNGTIVWHRGIAAGSVVIAIFSACVAYWILFRLLVIFPQVEFLRAASAIILAVAVNGMHYTGMAAATFVFDPNHDRNDYPSWHDSHMSQKHATYGAIVAGVVVSFLCMALALSDLRQWYYNLAKITKELDAKIEQYAAQKDKEASGQQFLADYKQLRFPTSLKTGPRARSHHGVFSVGSNAVLPIDEENEVETDMDNYNRRECTPQPHGFVLVNSSRQLVSDQEGKLENIDVRKLAQELLAHANVVPHVPPNIIADIEGVSAV